MSKAPPEFTLTIILSLADGRIVSSWPHTFMHTTERAEGWQREVEYVSRIKTREAIKDLEYLLAQD